jgi:hypothetical protein
VPTLPLVRRASSKGPVQGVLFVAHGYTRFDGAFPSKRFNTIWLLSESAQPLKSGCFFSLDEPGRERSSNTPSKRFGSRVRRDAAGRAAAREQNL